MTHARIPFFVLALGVLLAPSPGRAQARPFLFSITTAHDPGVFNAAAYADLAYGHDLDLLESRVEVMLQARARE